MHKIKDAARGLRTEAALFGGMVVALWALAALFRIDATHISYAAHFVAQDQSWLAGRMDVPAWLGHDLVHLGGKDYIVYPPMPALLMLPFVAALGDHFSDIWFGWLMGAANVALLYHLLRALTARGWSPRDARENVIIALTFGLGTIALWLTLGGGVWFEAQTVAIMATLVLLLGAVRGWWWLASAGLGALFLTRSPDVVGGIVVLACLVGTRFITEGTEGAHGGHGEDGARGEMDETLPMRAHLADGDGAVPRGGSRRVNLPDGRETLSPRLSFPRSLSISVSSVSPFRVLRALSLPDIIAFTLPFALAVGVWLARNWLAFGSPLESGYGVQIAQDYPQIQHGLLSWHYVWPNFVANFLNLPAFTFRTPYDLAPKVDLLRGGNGTSIFFTTPLFLLFCAPARSRLPSWLRVALWVTVALLVALTLLWNLTGWYQVGARYLFDAYPYLFVLLAARGGRIGARWLVLAGWGVAVNIMLAQVFWCHDGACFAGSSHRSGLYVALLGLVPLACLGAWRWLHPQPNSRWAVPSRMAARPAGPMGRRSTIATGSESGSPGRAVAESGQSEP